MDVIPPGWHSYASYPLRALCWLLLSPPLLDEHAPCWQGAALNPVLQFPRLWQRLQIDPAAVQAELDAFLAEKPVRRLGLYAEQLLAFALQTEGLAFRRGVQIHNEKASLPVSLTFCWLRTTDIVISSWQPSFTCAVSISRMRG